MILKKFVRPLEYTISIEFEILHNLNKISQKLLKEAESFKERNSLAIVGHTIESKKPIHRCCPQCLKAHLLKKSEEMNSGKAIREIIIKMHSCETGHYGYYLDGVNLIKI